jgi:hypothetical protein
MSKNIIIVISIIVIAGIGYGIFVYSNKTPSNVTARQVVGTSGTASVGNSAVGREFVSQLLAIQNIKFNFDIFKDPVFLGLSDFSKPIQDQPIGRPNPFAPIGEGVGVRSSTVNSTSTPASAGTTVRGTSTLQQPSTSTNRNQPAPSANLIEDDDIIEFDFDE